jgi:hypothetical protein
MNRRERKYLRDRAMEYARLALGVKRLPAGVPARIRAAVAAMPAPRNNYPSPPWQYKTGWIWEIIQCHYRPPNVL